MSLFGWSYPPGCSGGPYDRDDEFCEVCGGDPDSTCICQPCPVCEEVGDLQCYEHHGMQRSQAQIDQLEKIYQQIAEQDESEYKSFLDLDLSESKK